MRVVFSEEDNLFRLMEAGLTGRISTANEQTLRYFFGDAIEPPRQALQGMAARLGLPPAAAHVCADDSELTRAVASATILVTEKAAIDQGLIAAGAAGDLRLIQKFGANPDNIDLAAAAVHAIPVKSLVRVSTIAAAEHTLALILGLARDLCAADSRTRARRGGQAPGWAAGPPRTRFNWLSIPVRLVAGSCLGLIGMGENAQAIARLAIKLGMRVLYHKRTPLPAAQEAELGVRYASLADLLGQADFVSLNIPYGPATEKYVDAAFLARMRPTAYLINTARGGLVDEQALFRALQAGAIAGAALDVYRYEPIPADCPLLALDNVCWTPHMAGGSPWFMIQETEDLLNSIKPYLI